MIDKLDHLQDYKYYFQFTLNPYGEKLENNLPSVNKRIDIFKRLSDKIGKEKVIWRYDPILLSARYDLQYHAAVFEELAAQLAGSTKKMYYQFP